MADPTRRGSPPNPPPPPPGSKDCRDGALPPKTPPAESRCDLVITVAAIVAFAAGILWLWRGRCLTW